MAITVGTLGENSISLSYSPKETEANLSEVIRVSLSSLGWQTMQKLSDTKIIYRAPMRDGISQKYIQIDVRSEYMFLSAWENWNPETSEGTNETYYGSSTSYSQRYDFVNGGNLFIFASARYIVLLSRIAGDVWGSPNNNSWTGVFEIARDNPEEVAGDYPLFVWMTGEGAVGAHATTSNRARCCAYPRDSFGHTSSNAWDYQALATVVGSTHDNAGRLYSVLPSGSNPMSPTAATQVYTPYQVDRRNGWVRGRVYGLKILPRSIGSVMDKINVRVDSEKFYDANGATTRDHHILTTGTADCRFAIPE